MKFRDLRPGDIIEGVDGYSQTVISLSRGEGSGFYWLTTLVSSDALKPDLQVVMPHKNVWVDTLVHREGKEIYRGDKYEHVQKCMAAASRMGDDITPRVKSPLF